MHYVLRHKSMSRIGKKTIEIPQGVEVSLQNDLLTVKGKLGALNYAIPAGISVEQKDSQLVVTRATDQKRHRAYMD